MKLRPYQVKACNLVVRAWRSGSDKTLLILPTGCGKTVVFVRIAQFVAYEKDKKTRTGKKVLMLAHRKELLDQAGKKFETVSGMTVGLEQGKNQYTESETPVCLSSIQTMVRRKEKFPADYWDYIIVDEAHHTESRQYQKVLNYFKSAKVLGVTATPDRADGKRLSTFDSIAFEYTIGEAMKDGWLSPIELRQIPLSISMKEIKKKAGDIDEVAFGNMLNGKLHEIAGKLRPIVRGRRTVCFVPLIKTAQMAADLFSHYGFRSQWVSGADKERTEKLKAFADGEYDILFNSMLLTEGWDCPETDCIIVLRPTTSRALYVQMIGRGLRLAEGKENCLIVDFLYQDQKFDLTSPIDVIGINLPEEPKEKNEEKEESEKTEGEGVGNDLEESLLKRLEQAGKEQLARQARLAKAAAQKGAKNLRDNPEFMDYVEALADPDLADDLPSKRQEEWLLKRNVNPFTLTYGEAMRAIEWIKTREPLTDKQRWYLKKNGWTDEKLKTLNKTQASGIIGRMKGRNVHAARYQNISAYS